MAYEIERKFLVSTESWRKQVSRTINISQAYFCNTDKASLRIRITDDAAYMSVKSMTLDIRRHEFEYPVPVHDAEFMINYLCQGSVLVKQRHLVQVGGQTWEIDEFQGDNAGLIVAEIELEHEQQPFHEPDWLGQEVSGDTRFFNMNLVKHPYKSWTT